MMPSIANVQDSSKVESAPLEYAHGHLKLSLLCW